MDLRRAFHAGRVEGEALRETTSRDLSAMKQEVNDFINTLKTLKNSLGKEAFHVAKRDFIKSHESQVIWANGFSQGLTISIKDQQPFVHIQSSLKDTENETRLGEEFYATTACDAIEEICRWVGRAAPELETAFDDTFEKYDFIDVAP